MSTIRSTIKDNEGAVARALQQGNYVLSYLIVHSLIELLLRKFLCVPQEEEYDFADLVKSYKEHMLSRHHANALFENELTHFNLRKHRFSAQIRERGFSAVNEQTRDQAATAVKVYGLLIEYLETFDANIREMGFDYTVPFSPDEDLTKNANN